EGLYHWACQRFAGAADAFKEEEFRTQPRSRLHEILLAGSQRCYAAGGQEEIDQKLADTLAETPCADAEKARELVAWAQAKFGVQVTEAELTGLTFDAARQVLWNAFDDKFRPEMRGMERSLVLGWLDRSWKNHLYTMDH